MIYNTNIMDFNFLKLVQLIFVCVDGLQLREKSSGVIFLEKPPQANQLNIVIITKVKGTHIPSVLK